MTKEFKLSEKIITLEQIEKDQELFIKAFGRKENTFVIFTEDVKEFIKKLKEEITDRGDRSEMEVISIINNLAGDELC